MIRMQGLTGDFTKANPDITAEMGHARRERAAPAVTTDIATKGGQFDVLTIGTYEVPIWAKKNWLVPLDNLGADYDVDDLLPTIRDAVSVDGKLYAAPFYGESSMVDVPHRPVREGRPEDAGQPDLGLHRSTPPRS